MQGMTICDFHRGPADGGRYVVKNGKDTVPLWLHPWTAAIYSRVDDETFVFDVWEYLPDVKREFQEEFPSSDNAE